MSLSWKGLQESDGLLGSWAQDWVLPGRGTGGWERIRQPALELRPHFLARPALSRSKVQGKNILHGCCFLLN